MKVAHRYTMCKSNGFELLVKFPTTASGRQLAQQVMVSSSKTASQQGRRRMTQKITKKNNNNNNKISTTTTKKATTKVLGPLSRAQEKENSRPNTIKASLYQEYQASLEYNKRKKEKQQEAERAMMATKQPNGHDDNNSDNNAIVPMIDPTSTNNAMIMIAAIRSIAATKITKISSSFDDKFLILMPKNGNNKKKIKLRKKRNLTINTPTGCILNLGEAEHLFLKPILNPVSIEKLVSLLREARYDFPCYHGECMKIIIETFQEYQLKEATTGLPISEQVVEELAKVTLRSMKTQSTSASIQDFGCRIISFLVKDASERRQATIGLKMGAIEAVLECMKLHKENAIIQTVATRAIRQILLYDRDHLYPALDLSQHEGLPKKIVHCFHQVSYDFPGEAFILGNVFLVLARVCKRDEDAKAECLKLPFMGSDGGIVHGALTKHPTSASVQMGGWNMLHALFSNTDPFQSACITPKTVRAIMSTSSCLHGRPLPRFKDVAIQAILTSFLQNPSVTFHTIGTIENGGSFILEDIATCDTLACNPLVGNRIAMFKVLAGILPYCSPQVVEKHCDYYTKNIVLAMKEFAGNTSLEIQACRILDLMSDASAAVRRYILRGSFGGGNRDTSTNPSRRDYEEGRVQHYGEADDVLFATVQRYRKCNNDVFHAAGRLMFKIRETPEISTTPSVINGASQTPVVKMPRPPNAKGKSDVLAFLESHPKALKVPPDAFSEWLQDYEVETLTDLLYVCESDTLIKMVLQAGLKGFEMAGFIQSLKNVLGQE